MRFRYFDSEGTEVGLSSVEALRFRIETGVVTPETLLYDAAAGQWAPARQNPLFRFLVEEDESLLPEEHRSLMEGSGTSARAAPEPGARSEPDSEPDAGSSEPSLPKEEGGEEGKSASPLDGDTLDLSSMDPGGGETGALDDDGFPAVELSLSGPLGATEPGPEENVDATDPDGASDPDAGSQPDGDPEWDEEESAASGIQLTSDWTGGAGTPAPRPPDPPAPDSEPSVEWRTPGSVEPAARKRQGRASAAVDASSRWSPPKSKMEFRRSEPRRPRRPPSLVGVAALSILAAFVVGIPILILGGSGEGGEGSVYARVGDLAGDLLSGGGAENAEARSAPPAAGERDAEAEPGPGAPSGPTGPARLTSGEIDALADDVEASAAADLEGALGGLRRALELPDRPPAEWLEARYLAAADSFPRVERYWMSLFSMVKSMEELEGELYRGFVHDRVRLMGLDTADASRLSARVLARYERRSRERASVYRELELLASNALALHDTLEARSDLIALRPLEGAGLSRYPVMAALPDHPVLAEHIWSRMSRTLDLLQSLDGSRPETVAQIREAIRRTTLLATAGAAGVVGSGRPVPITAPSAGGDFPTAADLPIPTQDLPDLD